MSADDPCAVPHGKQVGGDRAAEPLLRLRRGDAGDEALARRADKQRTAESGELTEPGKGNDALPRGFAEADPRVEHNAGLADARSCRKLKGVREESGNIVHDVD